MASRLSWPAAALAGCLLVGALALLVRLPGYREARQAVATREEYGRLLSAVRAEALMLRVAAPLDSVRPLLGSGRGLTLQVRVPLRPAEADSLRAAVLAEVGDTAAVRARIGVFLIGARAWPEALWTTDRASYQIHGTTDPEPTCAVIGSVPPQGSGGESGTWIFRTRFQSDSGWVRGFQVLGGCRFWARYGAPGGPMGRWLARRGYKFADLDARAAVPWPDTLRTRGTFGRWLDRGPAPWPRTLACQGGDEVACMALLFTPATDASGVASVYQAGSRSGFLEIGPGERSLLAALESEFGPERFARFWTSGQDVALAFETAFGLSAGRWLTAWLARSYGPAPHGPGMSLASAGLSLLLIGALFATALTIHRGRVR